ncbi:MAG: FkbM family methyltransferase [Syntrophobacteraceae bacterium]|nr:FkbM family methyltransferase [Syntrophobacteraceae bacterium]
MKGLGLLGKFLPGRIKSKFKDYLGVPSMEWGLRNLYRNGFRPEHIWDIGAYEGGWALLAAATFPGAKILMIEPQVAKRDKLGQLTVIHKGKLHYIQALCGRQKKDKATFFTNETVSSVLEEWYSMAAVGLEMPMTTLDDIAPISPIASPQLIKLDVQGYELEVLAGASTMLSHDPPEVIVIEVSLIDINKGAPLWSEVDLWLSAHGYKLHDICGLIRRPSDRALWQTDSIYVRRDSSLVVSKCW